MIRSKLVFLTWVAAVAGFTLAGCSATPENTLAAHGLSVKHMIAEQTAEPWEEGELLDGEKSRAVLEAYRGDIGDPKSAEEVITDFGSDD